MCAPACLRVRGPQEYQAKSCCCFSRGAVMASVRLDLDKLQPGQSAAVILEVDNQSSLKIQGIQVRLQNRPEGSRPVRLKV